jgi:hypothetical protein
MTDEEYDLYEVKNIYEEFKRLRKLMGRPVRDIFGRVV